MESLDNEVTDCFLRDVPLDHQLLVQLVSGRNPRESLNVDIRKPNPNYEIVDSFSSNGLSDTIFDLHAKHFRRMIDGARRLQPAESGFATQSHAPLS